MFQSDIVPFGKYTRIAIHDPASDTGFSVAPEAGANVIEIYFNGIHILDGYKTPEELEVAKFGKSVLLFPFPNRLKHGKYAWSGKNYAFPINNADTGNAIHGFARSRAFEVEHIDLQADSATVTLALHYAGERPDYPFPCILRVAFTITNERRFGVALSCENRHDGPIPVGFGWHPYFRVADSADAHVLRLPPAALVEIDAYMIPTGAKIADTRFEQGALVKDTFIDNCFQVTSPAERYTLSVEGGQGRVEVTAPLAQWPFFQVFTPPHRNSVALEPMSCNVDAFNNGEGLVALAAGAALQTTFDINYFPK